MKKTVSALLLVVAFMVSGFAFAKGEREMSFQKAKIEKRQFKVLQINGQNYLPEEEVDGGGGNQAPVPVTCSCRVEGTAITVFSDGTWSEKDICTSVTLSGDHCPCTDAC